MRHIFTKHFTFIYMHIKFTKKMIYHLNKYKLHTAFSSGEITTKNNMQVGMECSWLFPFMCLHILLPSSWGRGMRVIYSREI